MRDSQKAHVMLPIVQMCFCEIGPCTRSKRFLLCCQLESKDLEEYEMVGLACPPRIRTARGSHLAYLLAIFVALNDLWSMDPGAAGFCRHFSVARDPILWAPQWPLCAALLFCFAAYRSLRRARAGISRRLYVNRIGKPPPNNRNTCTWHSGGRGARCKLAQVLHRACSSLVSAH